MMQVTIVQFSWRVQRQGYPNLVLQLHLSVLVVFPEITWFPMKWKIWFAFSVLLLIMPNSSFSILPGLFSVSSRHCTGTLSINNLSS